MRITVGADHRGYEVRGSVVESLRSLGHEVVDVGSFERHAVDYPDVAAMVGRMVSLGEAERGILIGRTGMGMCIVANKFPGVRAAACHDELMADMGRRYIDLNVLCLTAELLSPQMIGRIVETWLAAPFEGGRHERRVQRIAEVEQEVASRRRSG